MLSLLIAAVVAQPLAPVCSTPDRDGWNGPFTALSCSSCCGCVGDVVLEWELRIDGGTYASPIARGDAGALYIGDPFRGLTNQQVYCLRARYLDAVAGVGVWGPARGPACSLPAEVCFTWDSIPPTAPVLLDAGVSNAVFVAEVGPVPDVGSGLQGFLVYIDGESSVEVGVIPTQPVTHPLGPGDWSVRLQAVDRADNRSFLSAAVDVTVVASQQIPIPPAPTWDAPFTRSQYFAARWPGPPNGLWAVQQRRNDGGWIVASRPVVTDPVAFLDVGGPCTRTVLRTSRLFDGGASDWSAPSAELLMDRVDPVISPPTVVPSDGGLLISWAPAIDSCPSGVQYSVDRITGDGGSTVLQSPGLTLLDVPPAGTSRYRVVATDGAGNRGVSNFSPAISWPLSVADAGVADAGVADAGVADAGVADAGVADAGVADAGVADAGVADAGVADAGVADAGVADAGVADAGVADAGVADAGVADAGVADAGVADAGVADAGVADAGVADAGVADAGVADAGGPDAGDAGFDAGVPDAGLDDAGVGDAGVADPRARQLLVGCGCSAADWPGLVLALLLLRRRQPSSAGRDRRTC